MKRIACLAVVLVISTAHAEDKRTVAMLTIVTGDAGLTKTAAAITVALRTQATAKTSEYKVKGTVKEVESAISAVECNSLEIRCAAELGATLGAEQAITGELNRRGTHQVLVLSLVDTRSKQRLRSVHQTAASNADGNQLARAAYLRLVGGDLGDLAVVANAQRGEVLIDGAVVAGLFDGHATITGLVKGSHLLAIRAKGFRPFEVDITIESTTKQMLLLDPE